MRALRKPTPWHQVVVQPVHLVPEPDLSPADRKAKVDQLRRDGYARVGEGVPLSPGTYDVRERDGSATVLWRPKE